MQLDNHSKWSAALVAGWARNGHEQLTLVLKRSFVWNTQQLLTPINQPMCYADEYEDDDAQTGAIRLVSDTVPFKAGFEWMLTGSLQPRANETCRKLTVSVADEHSEQSKTVFVFGERHWQPHVFGAIPGHPKPLKPMPLSYRYAFGGQHETKEGKALIYEANPVGVGYKTVQRYLEQPKLMPFFETEPLLTSPTQRRDPAGFGPIAPHWQPRAQDFMAMNTAAIDGACPYEDEPPTHLWNSAPSDQRWPVRPKGEVTVRLFGFFDDAICLTLPVLDDSLEVRLSEAGKTRAIAPIWDTLLIDTDAKRIDMVFRAPIVWHSMAPPRGVISVFEHVREAVAV